MTERLQKIGFSYFTSDKYLINASLYTWLSTIGELGASSVIFHSDFSRAIPEDAFTIAKEQSLEPVVHFVSELPLPRNLNDAAVLLDVYAKRGVNKIVFGDRPNSKRAWPVAGWHYENLASHFLDRFIPLANYAVQKGLTPVFPPLQPGGDFWDTSFLELVLTGLKKRKLDPIIQKLTLASFGYTYDKPLSWGSGGPERWSGSKPYSTPKGLEDQLGFHNFEWVQAIAERILGHAFPVMILNAGLSGGKLKDQNQEKVFETTRSIINSLHTHTNEDDFVEGKIKFNDLMIGCYFSLEKLNRLVPDNLTMRDLRSLFNQYQGAKQEAHKTHNGEKLFTRYLLLPAHANNISDVVLNKVRPVIKKFKPTVGFSLLEASYAKKVIIYPDPILFTDEQINKLRAAGCKVEILPESGIEIATRLQVT